MEISIETLTGTSFELRVSPFETVISVKQKIQRLEGIPIAQQHLIWKNIELEDDFYLHDYGISHGSCLQLVLAMRGGPISTRRVVLEDPSLQEVIDYVEQNGEDMWNDLPATDNTQVTVLLFRDGDQLNFFRVIDRGDGTLTPLSESLSGNSMYNLYDEDEDSSMEERSSENAAMRDKVRNLKAKMRVLNANKKETSRSRIEIKPSPPPRPPMGPLPPHRTPRPPSDLNTPRPLASVSSGMVRRRMYSKIEDIAAKPNAEEVLPPLSGRSRQLPKLNRTNSNDLKKSLESIGSARQSTTSLDSTTLQSPSYTKSRVSSAKPLSELKCVEKLTSTLPAAPAKSIIDSEKINQYKRYAQEKREAEKVQSEVEKKYVTPDEILSASREVSARISSRISHTKLPPTDNKITKHVTYDINTRTNHVTARDAKSGDRKPVVHRLNSSDRKNLRTLQVLSRQGSASPPTSPLPTTRLPPVAIKTKVLSGKKKNVTRCSFCRKKTGLATTYTCHCEGTFCAIHRYAEIHKCPYDYKSAGRKILEQNNPVVTAPKLPKI